MKRFWQTLGAVVVGLSLTLAVNVEAKSKKKKEPPPSQRPVIASVSADSITITADSRTKTYAITRFTEVLVKGQRATLADLQSGMAVTVTMGTDQTKAARINASDAPVAPTK